MKIVTLVENTACGQNLRPEHGLSLYIETGGYKILFDMGQSDAFAHNAQSLGVDLSAVDFVVLSHGHYDHGGGLETFLKINTKAKVYIHKLAFGEHYNAAGRSIGLPLSLQTNSRLVFTEDTVSLAPGIQLTDCNELHWRFDSWRLCRREGDILCPDSFRHEQYLQITEGQKKILISGCSHKGIVNIAEHFRPDVLVGGFHLNKLNDIPSLHAIAETLKQIGAVYYTGHCTGEDQFAAMKPVMAEQLQRITTGKAIEV